MRLIDADALIEALRAKEYETVKHPTFLRSEFEEGFCRGINIAKEVIKSAPAIEAEPIKQGQWKPLFEEYAIDWMQCSECGAEFFGKINYCPNCGARMI